MPRKLPPSKPHRELNRLLREAARRPLTPAELWKQRVSFVYGQLQDCAPEITRDQVEARATEIYGPKPS